MNFNIETTEHYNGVFVTEGFVLTTDGDTLNFTAGTVGGISYPAASITVERPPVEPGPPTNGTPWVFQGRYYSVYLMMNGSIVWDFRDWGVTSYQGTGEDSALMALATVEVPPKGPAKVRVHRFTAEKKKEEEVDEGTGLSEHAQSIPGPTRRP